MSTAVIASPRPSRVHRAQPQHALPTECHSSPATAPASRTGSGTGPKPAAPAAVAELSTTSPRSPAAALPPIFSQGTPARLPAPPCRRPPPSFPVAPPPSRMPPSLTLASVRPAGRPPARFVKTFPTWGASRCPCGIPYVTLPAPAFSKNLPVFLSPCALPRPARLLPSGSSLPARSSSPTRPRRSPRPGAIPRPFPLRFPPLLTLLVQMPVIIHLSRGVFERFSSKWAILRLFVRLKRPESQDLSEFGLCAVWQQKQGLMCRCAT